MGYHLLAGLASAQAYKWVDEQGGVHFGDRPPEAAKSEEIVLPEGQRSRSLEGRVVDDQYLTWDGTVRIRLPFLTQPGAKIEARQVNKERFGLFMFDEFGAVYIVFITVNDNPLLAFEDIVREFQPRFELLDKQAFTTERGKELRLVQYRKGGSHLTSDSYEGGK